MDIQTTDSVSTSFLPLIFRNLKEDKMHARVFQTCKSMYRHTWSENSLRLFQLGRLVKKFQTAGIEVCLLKGIALLLRYYQDVGLRSMGDLDILISKNRVLQAIDILKEENWTPLNVQKKHMESDFLEQSHALLFSHPEGGFLDLHWAIFPESVVDEKFMRYSYRTQSMLLPYTDLFIVTLCSEDQLIHVLLHGLKYSPRPLIRWIPDAVMVIRKYPDFDWHYFFEQITKLEMVPLIKEAMEYLSKHEWVHLPLEISRKFHQYHENYYERAYAKFIKQSSDNLFFPFQLFWFWHLRACSSKSKVVALLTLPSFLLYRWKIRWYALPFQLMKRSMTYIWRRQHD